MSRSLVTSRCTSRSLVTSAKSSRCNLITRCKLMASKGPNTLWMLKSFFYCRNCNWLWFLIALFMETLLTRRNKCQEDRSVPCPNLAQVPRPRWGGSQVLTSGPYFASHLSNNPQFRPQSTAKSENQKLIWGGGAEGAWKTLIFNSRLSHRGQLRARSTVGGWKTQMWIKSLPMRVDLRYEERRGCFSGGGGKIQNAWGCWWGGGAVEGGYKGAFCWASSLFVFLGDVCDQ